VLANEPERPKNKKSDRNVEINNNSSLDYVIYPLFWLGLSLILVAASLTAVVIAALPALQEVARAARSAEKLFDTLSREFPPTLEAIRLTGLEISELTEDIHEGINSASGVVKEVDRNLVGAKQQVKGVQDSTRSLTAGFRAAWRTWKQPSTKASNYLSESDRD
jgi:uncharacterized protein YoxC